MHLVVVGLNHKTAPVDIREKLAVSEGDLPIALESLCACHSVAECCILSTCNRTEIYAVTNKREDEDHLIKFMCSCNDTPGDGFENSIYRHRGHKAVEHLFAVASGIDSMMIGEDQIMSQVKNAFCAADEADSTKTILNTLFKQALYVGKRTRSETEISRGAFSVGYAAVELARSIFGNLRHHNALIIGAGKMSELTAKHLMSAGVASVVVANRTLARAEELAGKLGGKAVPFEAFGDAMLESDIVITSTGSTEPIIRSEQMAKIMHRRRERPIFVIDIAVPRDVESEVGKLGNVFLYDMDDLQSLVGQSADERRKEIEKVRDIIADETHKFSAWMKTLEAVPLIKQLRQKLDGLKESEWERYGGKLAHLSEKDQETVRTMMQSLINKVSHDPLLKMKEFAADSDGYDKLEVARELFGIEIDNGQVE
jgi:glutamyl-tRNA reductase